MNCELQVIIVLTIVIALLLAASFKNRILLKLGLKNAFRRKLQIALVVSGLMIGTAMISGSLMMSDTLNYYFEKSVYDELHLIDEQISISSIDPERTYIPYRWFDDLEKGVKNESLIDGLAPRLQETLPVRDARTLYGEASLSVVGIIPEFDRKFGSFKGVDGKILDGSELGAWECYLTRKSAEKMEAVRGDTLLVFYKGKSWNLTLKEIIENEGKANSNGLFLRLETLQNITAREGKINKIIVSNKGGVEDSWIYSEEVKQKVLEQLNSTITAEDAGIYLDEMADALWRWVETNNTTALLLNAPQNLSAEFAGANLTFSAGICTNFMDFSLPEFLRNVYVNLSVIGINMTVPVNTTSLNANDALFGNFTGLFGTSFSDVAEGEIVVVNNFNINVTREINQFPSSITVEYLAYPDYRHAARNFTIKDIVVPEGRGNFLNATLIFNYTDARAMFGDFVNAYRINATSERVKEILKNFTSQLPVTVKSTREMLPGEFIENFTTSIQNYTNQGFSVVKGLYTDFTSPQPYNLKIAFTNFTMPNGTLIPLPLNIMAVENGTLGALDNTWKRINLTNFSLNDPECMAVGMLSAFPNGTLDVSALKLTGEIETVKLSIVEKLPGTPVNMVGNTTLVLNYTTALKIYSLDNGSVNFVRIEGKFGTREERDVFVQFLKQKLDELTTNATVGLEVHTSKADSLKDMEEAGSMISSIFLMLDGFTIAAGVVLIILIFYLLAEERKSELGIARAVGMQRSQLIQMFLYEGMVYAVISALVGSAAGIALGYLMIYLFTLTFASSLAIVGFTIVPHFEPISLLLAFAGGFLITMLTIFIAATLISKLNIVAAIRDIPEATGKKERNYRIFGSISLIIGILFLVNALLPETSFRGLSIISAPFFLSFGIAALAVQKYGHERLFLTLASLFSIIFLLIPLDIPADDGFGFDLFIGVGIYIVFAGVVLLIYNSRVILSGMLKLTRKTRSKRMNAVMKIAILYPMQKKLRTATTIFMFAIVIFSVTMLAMITGMQMGSVNKLLEDNAGGFDIFGFTDQDNPINNITEMIAENQNLSAADFKHIASFSTTYGFVYSENMSRENATLYPLYGLDYTFLSKNSYTFHALAPGYNSPAEVWEAIRKDPSLAVVDKNLAYSDENRNQRMMYGMSGLAVNVSEKLFVRNMYGQEANLTVIGIMNTNLIAGVFTSQNFLANAFNITNKTVFAIALSKPEKAGEIAKNLEKEFLPYGFRAIVLKDLLEMIVKIASNIMNLMQVFLGLGLIVGIAGISIVTLREVTERKREIGMLRALGFQKKMVMFSFLVEISFVALFGILLGVVLGIGVAYGVYLSSFGEEGSAPFMVPGLNIVLIVALAYLLTLALTSYAAVKASRVHPAEALRYIE
ncbi:MAG: FtsX-like permease family protein [Thermoplasmata archaeon]|nr:FtsX-like permease family protein [Thermoplasmata archaeon]